MRKCFTNVLLCCLFVLCFLGFTNKTVSASSNLSLPPNDYNMSGQYPAGSVKDVYYYSSETRTQRKMVVYTPPGYTTSKQYPVIYGIHGIDSWPSTIFDDWCVNADVLADNLIGQGKIEPVIIVAMDNNNVNSHNELMNVVIPYVESHYSVVADADHRGIYGYSMGGGVAFAEGIGNLDIFHHICPTSSTPFNHPSDSDMFPNGGVIAKQKMKTLVLSCGTIDWCGFYNANEATHKYCEANGIPHYWMSVPGGNHDGDVWSPAMWHFLRLAFPADGKIDPPTPTPIEPTKIPGEIVNVTDGWYYIKNVNADKYLQVVDNMGEAGKNVVIGERTGESNQKWYIQNLDNGYLTLKSDLGDFMIDVANASDADSANIQIYHAYSGDAQQFVFLSTQTEGICTIATKASMGTKVFDAERASKANGTNVCQYSYNGNQNQQWVLESIAATPTPVDPTPTPSEPVLKSTYTVNRWEGCYQVIFKITNQTTTPVNTWTLKVKKSEININTSWNVSIKEDDTYYVITPLEWNSIITGEGSVEFGVQGSGTIGDIIHCIVAE